MNRSSVWSGSTPHHSIQCVRAGVGGACEARSRGDDAGLNPTDFRAGAMGKPGAGTRGSGFRWCSTAAGPWRCQHRKFDCQPKVSPEPAKTRPYQAGMQPSRISLAAKIGPHLDHLFIRLLVDFHCRDCFFHITQHNVQVLVKRLQGPFPPVVSASVHHAAGSEQQCSRSWW